MSMKMMIDDDGHHHVSPVGSEGRVLGRLLIVSREDAKGGLQQLHRGHVSSEALGSHQSGNVNSLILLSPSPKSQSPKSRSQDQKDLG